jgi:iron complex outermembrane receptor protein
MNGTQDALDLFNRGVNGKDPITGVNREVQVGPSDRYLEKGTFFRLDEVSLGYTLPIRPNNYIQRCRISFTANNLLTFTGYTGLDPEITYSGLSFGVDNSSVYPRVRSFMFGVQMQF